MTPKLTVVTGPMFSGKTETALRYAKRALIAQRPVQAFVPEMDTRHGVGAVRSHAGNSLEALGVSAWTVAPENICDLHKRPRFDNMLVLLDEVQFMPESIVEQVHYILQKPRHVVVCGLATDFTQRPFGAMPALLAIADEVVKLTAICSDCKSDTATLTFKTNGSAARVELGGSDLYAPLCRACYGARVTPRM